MLAEVGEQSFFPKFVLLLPFQLLQPEATGPQAMWEEGSFVCTCPGSRASALRLTSAWKQWFVFPVGLAEVSSNSLLILLILIFILLELRKITLS